MVMNLMQLIELLLVIIEIVIIVILVLYLDKKRYRKLYRKYNKRKGNISNGKYKV